MTTGARPCCCIGYRRVFNCFTNTDVGMYVRSSNVMAMPLSFELTATPGFCYYLDSTPSTDTSGLEISIADVDLSYLNCTSCLICPGALLTCVITGTGLLDVTVTDIPVTGVGGDPGGSLSAPYDQLDYPIYSYCIATRNFGAGIADCAIINRKLYWTNLNTTFPTFTMLIYGGDLNVGPTTATPLKTNPALVSFGTPMANNINNPANAGQYAANLSGTGPALNGSTPSTATMTWTVQ